MAQRKTPRKVESTGDIDRSGSDDLEGWLGRNLRRATNVVFQHFLAEFEPFNIRPSLYTLMTLIERQPGSTGAQLSDVMNIPPPNTALLLQELEKRRLITRSTARSGDKRARAVALTKEGHRLLAQLHQAHARHVAHFDEQMTPAERAFLIALLQRIWRTSEQPPPDT